MVVSIKTKWTTPELIVLVRSKPKEAVLTICKMIGGGGFSSAYNLCDETCGYRCDLTAAS